MPLDLLFLSLLFFMVVCLFTLIKLVHKKAVLFAFIPLTIFLVGSTIYTYSNMLGHPSTQELPEDFLIISYIIKEPELIYLWTVKHRNDIPRAYQIPYEKNIHKKLLKMKKRIKQKGTTGIQIIRGKRNKDKQNVLDILLYNFVEQEFMKKDNER